MPSKPRTERDRFACEWIDHEYYYVQFRPENGMASGGVIDGDVEELCSNSSGSYMRHYEKGHLLQWGVYSDEIYVPMGVALDGVATLSAIRWS